ncbi:MAG TPA: hypothetical protein VFQ90_16765 [Stellaceae bacterium]|jgi:hypothetical protein|nr:hypothetical protein [Stellaceae bacterium]
MNDTAVSKDGLAPEPLTFSESHEALVERWWADHFPGSPVAAVTAAWNHAFAAKEELKRRLAKATTASSKEDN